MHPGSFDDTIPQHPELEWEALPELRELYFYPCHHSGETLPLIGIEKVVKKCRKLKRFHLCFYSNDRSTDVPSFSPTTIIECLATALQTLTQFSLACSYLMIHNLVPSTLLGSNMSMFAMLTNLDVKEQVFCHHWVDTNRSTTCLTDMLPVTVTTLTIRIHDKFRAIGDTCHLGAVISDGGFPTLASLAVIVQYTIGMKNRINDHEHYFIDTEMTEDMIIRLKNLYAQAKRDITEAFHGAKMRVSVTLEERDFENEPMYYTVGI
ncbi:hypothetical protein VHEMI01604 [[Torrubiella] hemipterigena]|uniref:Uncharacterized protein n=1 Tax=[Torrubiella] hemipterigena TaxID=1531966 RepID=A0A0A1T594_9HYPO|nr:hypothetical protein VHEMI01604 [[Torrubiella] hemipterigena]